MFDLSVHLNKLLLKNVKWNCSDEYQKDFEEIKNVLTSELLLSHFDWNLEIVVEADSGEKSIGCMCKDIFFFYP